MVDMVAGVATGAQSVDHTADMDQAAATGHMADMDQAVATEHMVDMDQDQAVDMDMESVELAFGRAFWGYGSPYSQSKYKSF